MKTKKDYLQAFLRRTMRANDFLHGLEQAFSAGWEAHKSHRKDRIAKSRRLKEKSGWYGPASPKHGW